MFSYTVNFEQRTISVSFWVQSRFAETHFAESWKST